MSSFVRRVLGRENSLHKKLRKAVANGKLRQVAALLDAGASPTWREFAVDSADELNALLIACHYGNVEILNLLIDSFFETPQLLSVWGRHMYCIVIRSSKWKAFKTLHERQIPMDPTGSIRSKLPSPAFVAAETGEGRMLEFLVKEDPRTAAGYSFNGHTPLSIASKNGHYECVEVLLTHITISEETFQFAENAARLNNQAHIVALLTSFLPEYSSTSRRLLVPRRPSVQFAESRSSAGSNSNRQSGDARESLSKPRRSSILNYNRGSIAETDILSDYEEGEEESRRSRRSSAWLYKTEQDLNVYRPYLESDDEFDAEDTRMYKDYLRGLDDGLVTDEEPGWASTPPVVSRGFAQSEDEKSAEKMLAMIAEKRESMQKPKKQRQSTWYYRNEVILPYENSEDSTAGSGSSGSPQKVAKSARPSLPPRTGLRASQSFVVPAKITQISRKVISIRSQSMQDARASM